MSQIDSLIRETITGALAESVAGTHDGTTPTRLHLMQGSLLNTGFEREMLEIPKESPVRWDVGAHQIGKQIAGWGPLNWQLQGLPSGSRLVAAGSTTALSHDLLYKHVFGRRYAAVGTTVSGTSATTTVITLTSATGRKPGELIAIETVAGIFEVRAIVSISGSDVTVSPALSTAPTTNGFLVRGVRTFALAETRSETLSIEQRMVLASGTAHEYRVLGAMASQFGLSFGEFGKIPTFSMQGSGMSFSGPAALSAPSWALGNNPGDSDMDAQLPWTPVMLLNGTVARFETGTFKLNVPLEADPIPDGSKPSGIGGWLDTSGRDGGMHVNGEFVIRADSAEITSFEAGTIRNMIILIDPNYGAATTTMAVIEIPRMQVISRSKPVSVGKGRYAMGIKWKALMDTKTAASVTAENLDLARTSIRFGLV